MGQKGIKYLYLAICYISSAEKFTQDEEMNIKVRIAKFNNYWPVNVS